ncbi:Septin-7 [Oopsacas minuta]|uniref:Septin n=1 Tax=Oopsacas minuta TaxID=111878 RepID=A0AAV7JFL2_9METZ|nr:Septin-7 [Oopsacas minuta]
MEKVLSGYVGFGNLPSQVYKKSVSNGFEFTLMVVGASGLGKSTLINSLFLSDIYSELPQINEVNIPKTTTIESTRVHIVENEINLTLNLVDTPGFADCIDNSNCWEPILSYIHDMYEDYFENESKVHRTLFEDRRVHCCLYFISPNGRGLKDLDITFMKVLHDKVNLIPIIAKADTFSYDELVRYKRLLLQDIRANSIKIYDFSYKCTLIDDKDISLNNKFIERLPFGVVGSNRVIEVDGKLIHGREYPWGIIDINNIEHCDFSLLKDVLIRYHMQNLKDLIHTKLYERFRAHKLDGNLSPLYGSMDNTECSADLRIQEDELEAEYRVRYSNLLNRHNIYINDLKTNMNEFDSDLKLQQQNFDLQQVEYIEEKRTFEEDHVNFVISVTDTGRSGSIGGKRVAKKSKH